MLTEDENGHTVEIHGMARLFWEKWVKLAEIISRPVVALLMIWILAVPVNAIVPKIFGKDSQRTQNIIVAILNPWFILCSLLGDLVYYTLIALPVFGLLTLIVFVTYHGVH